MSLAWSSVKALSIPVGGTARDVKRVSVGGVEVWRKLPYDAEVEYIESTGTQYINTGITPNSATTAVLLRAYLPQTGAIALALFGSRASANSSSYNIFYYPASTAAPNKIRVDFGDGAVRDVQNSLPDAVFGWATIGISGNTISVAPDGASTLTYSAHLASAINSIDMFAFAINTAGAATQTQANVRISSLQISVSGVLVRDYIPVRVGSGANAVGYLYDRANPTGGPLGNGLYGNSGTGAFVVGPDYGTSLSMSPFLELVETDLNPSDADATT